MTARIERWRLGCAIALAIFFGAAGVLHIALPQPFLHITPGWVPEPERAIFLTGLCEIAGAIGLLVPRTRRYAGAGLSLYAICVFPANIKHAYDTLSGGDPSLWQWVYHAVRLPLQPVIVWLALFAGNVVGPPFRKV